MTVFHMPMRHIPRPRANDGESSERKPSEYAHSLGESVAVLAQAVEANERQISEVAHSTSEQIKDVLVLIKEQGAQTAAKFDSLQQTIASYRVTNWPTLIAALMAIAMLVGAAYKIADLQTQVTMSPVVAKAEVSERDRSSLHDGQEDNRKQIELLKGQQKVVTALLKEVETQFKAGDQTRNIQFAEQQRMNNIMMQMAQGKKPIEYPIGPYFHPSISSSQDGLGAEGQTQ